MSKTQGISKKQKACLVVVLVLVIGAIGGVVFIPRLVGGNESAWQWEEVTSYVYSDPERGGPTCTALVPECGVCGYGDDAANYKLVGKKCYVKVAK
jgi:hypothetical protein